MEEATMTTLLAYSSKLVASAAAAAIVEKGCHWSGRPIRSVAR